MKSLRGVPTRPVIAITGPNDGGLMAWCFTALNVKIAGGLPKRVQAKNFSKPFKCDGVIIGGGSDVHPDNYSPKTLVRQKRSLLLKIKEALLFPQEIITKFFSSDDQYDKERDALEKSFIDYAYKENLPILGICRGEQLINAHLGGSNLTSTLPLHANKPRIRTMLPRKRIEIIKKNSLLAKIVNKTSMHVNAIHSQAVAEPAAPLHVVACERDNNIVQAIESNEKRNLLGVQWHPEYLIYKQDQRNIFSWLINEAK